MAYCPVSPCNETFLDVCWFGLYLNWLMQTKKGTAHEDYPVLPFSSPIFIVIYFWFFFSFFFFAAPGPFSACSNANPPRAWNGAFFHPRSSLSPTFSSSSLFWTSLNVRSNLSRSFNVVRANSTIQSSTRWLRSTIRRLDASRGRATTNKNKIVSPQRKPRSSNPYQGWERYHHLWSRPTHRMNGGWIEVHSSTAIFAVNPAKPRVSSYRTLQWLALLCWLWDWQP